MKIQAFRITNFRSIVDSNWVALSPDGISVLVGQNESGKSSILEALNFALSEGNPTDDDCRIGADLPCVRFRIELSLSELEEELEEYVEEVKNAVHKFLAQESNLVELKICWTKDSKGKFEAILDIETESLRALLDKANSAATTESPAPNSTAPATVTPFDSSDLAAHVWHVMPLAVLFNEDAGRLPNQVDIDDKNQPFGAGAKAAQNFLEIAEIDLSKIVLSDQRVRENVLKKANAKVSENFNNFWSQTIGKSGKLELKCDIRHYSNTTPEKVGKPYLVFWICDGSTHLYPMQRSQGVRWFISFFLQLKASEKRKQHRVFLLDEPGANLHSKAQADVLKLINLLGKDTCTVIYSTHSPQMLEYPKLFRVHAVQRDGEQDDSPTIVIDAHRLGTASSDTLSPVLAAMGVDLSHQQVIRKSNNVLLEEMSGYYYLTSFWKLTNTTKEAHFIAATGVNKIEALANMFRGWGLDFIVAVDDDKQGREAYKSIKKELYGDDEAIASRSLLKFPDCPGIEDVFSTNDFKQFVLLDAQAVVTGSNAEYMKSAGRSKPVAAFQFALSVEQGKVIWANLEQATQKKISAIVSAITSRLP
ncbi:MAG TPA: AAA family ATPase [Sideroxyarcus sp.]|nr:AAA family ATPase [Sideroxyarcus sp.]